MSNKFRRILAMALVLVMIFTMTPLSVYADDYEGDEIIEDESVEEYAEEENDEEDPADEAEPEPELVDEEELVDEDEAEPMSDEDESQKVADVGGVQYASLAEAVEAAENGATVTLLGNVDLTSTLTIPTGKIVTLDLSGKTITYSSTVQGEAMITNYGTLTIVDPNGGGVINYNYTGAADSTYSKGNYTISNAGTLTVEGGKITIADLKGHAKYPINNNSTSSNAVLVINGGHLYNYNTSAIRQFCNSTTYENSVTINGGVIEGYCAIWMQNPGSKTVKGKLSITDGEIRTTAAAYVNGTAALTEVSSALYCTIDGEGGAWSEDSSVSITGGTINENVDLSEAAPATLNVTGSASFNGNLTVPASYVAMIGDVGYNSLLDALSAAQDGETVVMCQDVELNTRLIFSSYTNGKNVTLDGNGYKLYASSTNWGTGNGKHLINVNCDNVTLKDITLDCNSIAEGVNIYKAQNIVFDNVTIINKKGWNADLTVNGSTLTVKNKLSASYVDVDLGTDVTTALGITAETGAVLDVKTLMIDSAAYPNTNLDNALSTDGTSYYSIKKLDADGNLAGYANSLSRLSNGYSYQLLEDVTVSSNVTLLNAGHTGTLYTNGHTLTVADGKALTVNGDLTIAGTGTVDGAIVLGNEAASVTGIEGLTVSSSVDGSCVVYKNGEYISAPSVAQIGETNYGSLADAIAAAKNGDTVYLLIDSSEDVTVSQKADLSFTIDGNGKTYSGTITIHGNARYTGAETLTIQNVNFTTTEAGHYFIDANETGSVERYAHNVKVSGCTFTATGAGVNSACAMRIRQGYNITMTGCTVTNLHSALQAYGCSGITVENTEIKGGKNGLSMGTSTNVKVSGSTIEVTGYGIRADGSGAYDLSVATSAITANLPIVVRYATGAYKLTLGEGVALTDSNDYGYQVTFTTGDDGTYEKPADIFTITGAENLNVFPTFNYVAQIGDTKYESFDEAITAAQDGDTVTLLKDVDYGTDHLEITKAITLDLGGNTLTTRARNYGLALKNDGIIITNGKLNHAGTVAAIKLWSAAEITDLDIDVTGTSASGNPISGIVIQQDAAGVKIIKNVKIYSTAGQGVANGIETYNCGNATAPVIGSMEDVSIKAVGTAMNISAPVGTATNCSFIGGTTGIELWIKGTYSATLDLVNCEVKGGTQAVYIHDEFSSNPDIVNDGTLQLTLDEATAASINSNETPLAMTIARAEDVSIDEKIIGVATIGGVHYRSLADAIAAAKDGETVTLLEDVTISEMIKINAAITLDLDGNKVTATSKKAFEVYANAAIIDGTIEAANRCVDTRTAVELTLTDVELIATATTYGNTQPLTIGGYDDGTEVTLNNVTIDAGDSGYGIITFVETQLTATNSTINGYAALFVKEGSEGSTFTVNGSKLVGTNTSDDTSGSNDFATVVLEAEDITVDIKDGSYVRAYNEGLANQYIFSIRNTGAKVTVSADSYLTGAKVMSAVPDDALINSNTIKIPAKYKARVQNQGFAATEADADGLITVQYPVAEVDGVQYSSLDAAVAAAEDGDTVKLLCDITMTGSVSVENDITLDLGGYTITASVTPFQIMGDVTIDNGTINMTGDDYGALYVCNYASSPKLTLGSALTVNATVDCAVYVRHGTLVSSANISNASENYAAIIGNGGYDGTSITINGGSVTAENSAAIYHPQNGALTVNGGTISGLVGIYFKSGKLEITGGTITATGVAEAYEYLPSGFVYTGDALVIENVGGTAGYEEITSVSITGGTFTSANANAVASYTAGNDGVEAAAGFISGGTFSSAVPEEYCAEGYVPSSYTDGEGNTFYTVREAVYVAEVNGKQYESIQEAISAVEKGATATVKVIADYTDTTFKTILSGQYSMNVYVANGRQITLDLNGHDVHFVQDTTAPYCSVFMTAYGGAGLTVTDSVGGGEITYTANTITQDRLYLFWANTGTTININGGTFSTGTDDTIYNHMIYASGTGTINVTGGTFYNNVVDDPDNEYDLKDIFNASGTATLNVTGGTYNEDISKDDQKEITGGALVESNRMYTVYATLADAVAAAEDGDTVNLLGDVEMTDNPATLSISKSITIDGNGHTITQVDSVATDNHALFYMDNNSTVTVKNTTFDGVNGSVIRTVRANVVIDNCVFQNGEHTGHQGIVRCNLGDATITNSQFLNNTCTMVVTFDFDATNDTDTFVVDNCLFQSNTCNQTAVVYYVDGDGATVTNCEFIENNVNATSNAAVVYFGFNGNCVATNNLFQNNAVSTTGTTTRVTGGIFLGPVGEACNISNNAFVGNTASNANGTDGLGKSVCISTAYAGIDLSGNYWDGDAPEVKDDYIIQNYGYQSNYYAIEMEDYMASYTTDENGNVVTGDLTAINNVATVGGVYYTTLAAAVDAAKASETVTLLTDVEENVEINKDITVDLNGKTVSSTGDAFIVTAGTVTITGNGVVKAGTSGVGSWCAVWANGGNVVIENGTYSVGGDTSTTDTTHQNDVIYTKNGGTVTIKGGTFLNDGTVWTLNENDANRNTITVYGGTFQNWNPGNNVSEGEGTSFVAEGYIPIDNGDGTYTVRVGKAHFETGAYASATPSKPREHVGINVYDVYAEESLVVKVYSGDTLIATSTYRDYDLDALETYRYPLTAKSLTVNIVVSGKEAGSWDNVWYVAPSISYIPDKFEVYVDGVLTDTWTEGFKTEAEKNDYIAFEGVYKPASVTDAEGNVSYYATLAEAVAAAESDATVTLLSDVTLDKTIHIVAGKTITLDLNGYTINFNPDVWVYGAANSGTALLTVDFGGDLTIEDTSAEKTGTIDGSANVNDVYGAVMMTAKGDNAENGTAKLTVNGGTLIGGYAAIAGNKDRDNTEIVINGGTVKVGISETYSTTGIEHPMNGTLTITGGTIEGMDGISLRSGTLTITGGTIIGNAPASTFEDDGYWDNDFGTCTGHALQIVNRANSNPANETPTVTITGGTFTAENNSAVGSYAGYKGETPDTQIVGFISGGTFSSAVPEEYCAAGYIPADNGDGTYGVKEGAFVASIDNVTYDNLAEALAAAKSGDTVTLLTDCTEGYVLVTPGVTLDLAGHTLTADYVVGFGAANVIDSSNTEQNGYVAGGLLKIKSANLVLSKDNGAVPVYNPDKGGYIFVDFLFNSQVVLGDGVATVNMLVTSRTMEVIDLLKDGAEDNNVQVVVRFSWDNDTGTAYQDFVFNEATIQDVMQSNNGTATSFGRMFYVNITGMTELKNVTATVMILTGSNAVDSGKVLNVN